MRKIFVLVLVALGCGGGEDVELVDCVEFDATCESLCAPMPPTLADEPACIGENDVGNVSVIECPMGAVQRQNDGRIGCCAEDEDDTPNPFDNVVRWYECR